MSQIVSIRARDTAVKRSGERGFALLEILVAFVILALGLGAVLTGVAVAMRSDARTQSNRVALRLTGESPRRYFDAAPHVRILVGDREVGAFDPAADFDQSITLPAALLAAANGRVVLESSKFFVPGGAGGGGDRRHLALRIYGVTVE